MFSPRNFSRLGQSAQAPQRSPLPLSQLAIGQVALISHTQPSPHGPGLNHRLAALGVLPGRQIQVLRQAAFGGPLHVRVGLTTEIALRPQEAAVILLNPKSVGDERMP